MLRVESTQLRFLTRLLAFCLLANSVYASDAGEPGRLLTFGAGARSLGMGTAYTAIAQDATSSYWNPAGLAAVRRNEFNFLHAALYEGATYDYMGYGGLRLGDGVLGGHLARLGVDGAQLRDTNNNLLGSFGYSETDLGLGYGMVLSRLPTLGLGVGANMISRNLNGSSDRLIGLDFASQYALTRSLGLGIVFKNALRTSQGDTDDKLPQKVRLGAGYQPVQGLTFSGDLENFSQVALGAEYSWKVVAARVGMLEGAPTFGAGLNWRSLTFDMAFASTQDLGTSQRISIGYAFGKPKGTEMSMNPDASSERLRADAEDNIQKGYYAEAERLLRTARRVRPDDHTLQDRLERLALVTPYIRSAVGWDRINKLTRLGINDYLEGKNIDGLWRMTYAYSIDKNQAGLWRVIEAVSHQSNYQMTVYNSNSPLTLTQQVLAQALAEFRAQHYDQAVAFCQRVISLEPDNSLAYKRLGSAFYALHQFDAAKTAWQKALAYETNPAAQEQLKGFIDMARTAALGLPPNMPGDATSEDDSLDIESGAGQ